MLNHIIYYHVLKNLYNNLMVDLKVSNNKLLDRAIRIVSEITGLNYNFSLKILKKANYNVKVAIAMELLKITYEKARNQIELNHGSLSNTIK